MHGSLSPELLKQECYLVGRVFQSKALGRLLWSLVLQESKAGTEQSQFGGVCSISFKHFEQMKKHHLFLKFDKRIKAETGLLLDRIQYQQLAACPVLSLIVSSAWFLADVDQIPRCENEQDRIISRYWTHNTTSIHA